MNIFTSKDRLYNYLDLPLSLMAIVSLILYITSMLPFEHNSNSYDLVSLAWCVIMAGLASSICYKSYQRAIVLSIGALLSNLIHFMISGECYGYAISLALSLGFVLLTRRLDFKLFTATVLVSGGIIGILLGFLAEPMRILARELAGIIKNNGVIFGFINEPISLAFGEYFQNLFFTTDYGNAMVIDEKIVAGAKNIFVATVDNPNSITSRYLTGKYFATLFLPAGIFSSLLTKTRKSHLYSFVLVFALSIIAGDNMPFSIYLLFYNPLIYLGYLIVAALGYLASALIDINLGFVHSASVIEMIRFHNDMIYFILVGLILGVIMYFATEMVLSKYDIDSKKYIPKDVRYLVKSLGGERNFVSLDKERLIVKNPNLINILNVDCEIHENEIILLEKDYKLLEEYY